MLNYIWAGLIIFSLVFALANDIGDLGMHVVKCLWCYERFHRGEEPVSPEARGRWLGEVYTESNARLNFRRDVLDFLQLKRQMDPAGFGPFKTAAFKVFAMAAIGIPILGFVALQLRRAGKAIPPDSRPRGGPLVAGRQ